MLSLYVHIPFCLRKCSYCNFVITVDRSETMRHRFFTALELEVRAAQEKYGRLCFDTVYFGGGTPSALSAEETVRLFALLKQFFDFKPGAEITWEVNPGDVDLEKIQAYRRLGINRVSLGIQSFQEASLKDMARPHGSAEVYETMRLLRAHEFQNISVDLILRLPGESLDIMRQNIQAALALEPAQFTLYDLEVNVGTVYGVRAERGDLTLISETEHEKIAEFAEQTLEAAGYGQYSLGVFARPGFESRHNLNYWHNGDYLALGPGAYGYMRGVRYQDAPDVRRWMNKWETGARQPDAADVLSAMDQEKENLLTGLRLREGVQMKICERYLETLGPRINELIGEGLLETNCGRLILTKRGRFLFESVSAELV